MEPVGEIFVLPFYGQGHLFPCIELCKHLSCRNYKTTLIIPSHLSSCIPTSLHHHHPLVEIVEIATSTPPPPPPPLETVAGPKPGYDDGQGPHPFHHRHQQQGQAIESFLSNKYQNQVLTRPAFAVLDVMMSWSKEIFAKFDIQTVSFFTSGACSAAMEYGAWKAKVDDMKKGEIRILPGLPEDMAISYPDLMRRPRGPHGPPPHGNNGKGGPLGPDGTPGGMKRGHHPTPGEQPRWIDEVEGSIALLINTCNDLERPFITYLATQIGKPVWGVGPLLPEKYWKSIDSVFYDRDVRTNRQSNYTEDEVIGWLDSKPRGSVIYVSFGSEVGPTLEEYEELANALEELSRPFIWVIQPGSGIPGPPPHLLGAQPGPDAKEKGYYPDGLETKVGDRGLIIYGWAPQLMILSHPSTGGFLSHCGWNSTVEAIGRGVPLLAWPIRGDQYIDAKLVVEHLRMGYMVSSGDDPTAMIKKDEIVKGIERLMMGDEKVHKVAAELRSKFECGFPASSVAALDAFMDFIGQNRALRKQIDIG